MKMVPMEFERMSKSMKSSQIREELDYRVAIADCFLDLSEACIRNHAYDDALKYIELSIHLFNTLNGDLSSPRIETSLRALANTLPQEKEKARAESVDPSLKPVCLHVMNEASAFGGLISMTTRWIQIDKGDRIHSVALLSQELEPPAELVQAVSESGGAIHIADRKSSILQRAAWLRNLARDLATYVILHIDSCNLPAAIAFGAKGGPPVLLVNHPGHMFWVGVSAPDIVVNVRGSQLEEYWTKAHRGAKNCATIPVPLTEPQALTLAEADRNERKSRARELLGVPKDSVVVMTSGASYKYRPLGKIDFLKTCQEILETVPEAYVLAAGVIEDDRWRDVSSKLGFRVRALGSLPQSGIALLHQASDIYIEGFPFGSTTALLEAGLQGIPVVLAPAECPPPYGTDGVSVDDTLERPASLEHYKSEVVRLCRNPHLRASVSAKLQKSILAHHTGDGWRQYVNNALQALPREHCVHPVQTPLRTPPAIYEYWCEFMNTWEMSRSALDDQILCAFSFGLRPKITPKMKLACKSARRLRTGGAIPLPLLTLSCNYCLAPLPLSWARVIFRTVMFFFRGRLLDRVSNKIARMFRRTDDLQLAHEHEYRYIREHPRWFGAAKQAARDQYRERAQSR
jgi:hypothetical protein